MRILLLLVLCSPLLAQNVSVQWTTEPAQGFVAVKDWAKLPKLPDPAVHKVFHATTTPGWVAAIKIGPRIVCCCDHYAVTKSKGNVTSFCWRDGRWYPYGAEVCTYKPELTCTYYGDWHAENVGQSPVRETRLAWDKFVPPPEKYVRHGLTVGNSLWLDHKTFWGQK